MKFDSVLTNIKQKVTSFMFKDTSHLNERIDTLDRSVKQSFLNLRRAMEHVSKWLYHFKAKNEKYEKQIQDIMYRLNNIEMHLDRFSNSEQGPSLIISKEKPEQLPNDTLWESLTETQQKICWKIAVLQKEMPNQWISLKCLAQEIYPDRDYSQVRSTLSQFITALEEMGIVQRKRKGKQTYVYSTSKNPCLNKKRRIPAVAIDKEQVNGQ